VSFYVDEALAAGGEVVELGVGTGRIAIPTALAGAHVIGVDSSAGMLAVCAERAREAGSLSGSTCELATCAGRRWTSASRS
jgi:ubiquinone/menaquinone biosynthesis C-methylase UbiE